MAGKNSKWNKHVRQSTYLWNPNHFLRANKYLPANEKLNPSCYRILEVLLSFDGGNEPAYPSRETIALYTGISERQIDRNLKKLVAEGWLKIEKKKAEDATHANNRYDLLPFYEKINALAVKYPPENLKNT